MALKYITPQANAFIPLPYHLIYCVLTIPHLQTFIHWA